MPGDLPNEVSTSNETLTNKKECIYYLKNFINVVSMRLPHGLRVTLAKPSLEYWTGRFPHPAFTVEFHSKDLVLGVFHYLIARFHY